MDPDCSERNNYQTPVVRKKPLVATPVSLGSSGEGLPYAPEDWPCPGDVWGWKVGRRYSLKGFWVDRSLRPPHRLLKKEVPISKQSFYSRVLVEQYVRKEFPEADVKEFFDSFIWKIPCKGHGLRRGDGNELTHTFPRRTSQSKISLESRGCKAGNKMCCLQIKARSHSPVALECNICCSESGFCRDCCCILCCKTIDWSYNGYSFIRCEATIEKDFICGHVAHVECALRASLAGTVGGSIGLDVEYYCRRCDNKTDLISHVSRILETCQSLNSQVDVEKILSLALSILHGSEQMRAKALWKRIKSVMTKLKSEACLEDIWKEEDSDPVLTIETGSVSTNGITLLGTLDVTSQWKPGETCELGSSVGEETYNGRTPDLPCITSDYGTVSMKVEDEVDQALQELRKSQESEYNLAERKLYSRKDYLLSLYQQLHVERSELAKRSSSRSDGGSDILVASVSNRMEQIKREETKLRRMLLISKGFGQVSKQVLKDYFQLVVDD